MFNLKKWSPQEVVLATAIVLIAAIYSYFFIYLPQYWTLRDDYGFALKWGANPDKVVDYGWAYLKGIMTHGRFQPMDVLNRVIHYGILPIDARYFRISFFISVFISVVSFVGILRVFGCARDQILLAVLLLVSNHSLKEMLTTMTVSERIGAMYFMVALWAYSANWKNSQWWALLIFPLSFFGKESFVVLAPVFAVVAFFQKNKKSNAGLIVALLLMIEALIFVIFIRNLPKLYTEGLSYSNLGFFSILRSFVEPLIKSFGPGVIFILLPLSQKKIWNTLSQAQRALVAIGAATVVIFTLFINMWGPFDSWFYLHVIIPFGWAFIVAGLVRSKFLVTRVGFVFLALTIVYQVISVVNGSKNYYDYFERSRQVADYACHEWRKNPHIKLVSNCHEGSQQLSRYLLGENKCASDFKVDYLRTTESEFDFFANTSKNTLVLYSRYCDNWVSLGFRPKGLSFGAWTVVAR